MCSLHPGITKKFMQGFDELRAQCTGEVSDDTIYQIKMLKMRAYDAFTALKGCQAAERYLRVVQSPTPQRSNPMMVQNNLELLIKTLR